ncbi:MAG: recombinase family protein [Candidatus Aminicenantales bacterium]|jgi:hypothetical protein
MRKNETENVSAIGWVRVSTAKQERFSPEDQKASIRRYGRAHGFGDSFEIVSTTESGWKKGKRDDFYRLLNRIREERISNLITVNGERLSRDPRGLCDVVDLIREVGLSLRYSETGQVFDKNNIDSTEQQMGNEVYHARKTVSELKMKARRSMENRIEKGVYPLNRLPYGYERAAIAGDSGHRNIVPSADAPLVGKAFALYATGHESEFSLWMKMKAAGCPLSVSALNQLLRTTTVIGYFPWPWPESKFVEKNHTAGEWIRGAWEPLVERGLWDRVQAIAKARTRSHPLTEKQTWMRYRGMLKCQCESKTPTRHFDINGKFFSGVVHGKAILYVPNHKADKKAECCSERSIRAEDVDRAVEEALRRFEFPPQTYDRLRASLLAAKKEDSRDVRAEETRLRAEVKTVDEMIEKAAMKAWSGTFSAEEITRAVQSLRDRKEKAEALLALLNFDKARFIDDSLSMLELVNDIGGSYRRASERHKAELLRVLFREIEVKDGRLIFHPDGPFEMFFSLSENPGGRLAVQSKKDTLLQYPL